MEVVHNTQQTRHEANLNPACNDITKNDSVNIMQQQNDITALLVQQNLASAHQWEIFLCLMVTPFIFNPLLEPLKIVLKEKPTTWVTACTSWSSTPGVSQESLWRVVSIYPLYRNTQKLNPVLLNILK